MAKSLHGMQVEKAVFVVGKFCQPGFRGQDLLLQRAVLPIQSIHFCLAIPPMGLNSILLVKIV